MIPNINQINNDIEKKDRKKTTSSPISNGDKTVYSLFRKELVLWNDSYGYKKSEKRFLNDLLAEAKRQKYLWRNTVSLIFDYWGHIVTVILANSGIN